MQISRETRVWVVDNDPEARACMQRALAGHPCGFRVDFRSGLRDLVSRSRHPPSPPDVLVCGQEAFAGSGDQFVPTVRAAGITAPVIALVDPLTGNGRSSALPAGVDRTLPRDEHRRYAEILPALIGQVLGLRPDGNGAGAVRDGDSTGPADSMTRQPLKEELRRVRGWLHAILESQSGGVALELENGDVGVVNGGFREMFGLASDSQDAVPRTWNAVARVLLDSFEDAEDLASRMATLRRGSDAAHGEVWALRDGRAVEIDSTPLRAPGTEGRLWSFRDVTRRRRDESAARWATRMEATSTLAGGIAHEFNNLMLVVRGHAEMLMERIVVGDDGRRMLQDVIQAASRAGELSQQMLTYCRDAACNPSRMNLNGAVREIVSDGEFMNDPRIRLQVAVAADLWDASIDVRQLTVVVRNLLSNATESIATESIASSGCIRLSTFNTWVDARVARRLPGLAAGPHVVLAVRDDGCGMDEHTRRRVFEPFFSTKFQGRGLGLSAVYGIVKQHDGHIEVRSALDSGTEIRVYLPAVGVDPPR